MTAHRLVILTDDAAAQALLNDLRDGQRKVRDAERKGDETRLFFEREWYAGQAVRFADAVLAAAVYVDNEPDQEDASDDR